MTKNNKEELFEFFLNSDEGAYMWRGQEDIVALSNMYQVKITVITIRGVDDDEPSVNVIEPNQEPLESCEVSAGQVPEMILLNEENSHYDLIVPAYHMLTLEGGLDYQRAKHGITRNEGGKGRGRRHNH